MFRKREAQLPLAVYFYSFRAGDVTSRNGCSRGCFLWGLPVGLQLPGRPHAQVIPDLISKGHLEILQNSALLLQSSNTFWPLKKVTEERASAPTLEAPGVVQDRTITNPCFRNSLCLWKPQLSYYGFANSLYLERHITWLKLKNLGTFQIEYKILENMLIISCYKIILRIFTETRVT